MEHDDARRLLDRIGRLRHPCDLDLLIFFARHPHSLLTSETLASFLGYRLSDIADSLEMLLGAGLLTRRQGSAHAARLYVLAADGTDGGADEGWRRALLALASTRPGRLALKEGLAQRGGSPTIETRSRRAEVKTRPRPRLVGGSGTRRLE